MLGLLFVLLTSVAGAFLAKAAMGRGQAWSVARMLGPGIGAGVASLAFFLLRWSGIANAAVVWSIAVVMLTAGVVAWRRTEPAAGGREAVAVKPRSEWIWVARIAVILSLALLVGDAMTAYAASPDGDWDAFSIWDLRARFMAAEGSSWVAAARPGINAGLAGASHPGYPLLLSGWIGMAWMADGEMESVVPGTVSVLFALIAAGVLFAGMRELRGEWSALLAVLVLVSPEAFRSQAGAQCADIALSLYLLMWTVLTAIWLRDRDQRGLLALAGLTAGLAPWTKNEGWPFALAAVAVTCWLARRGGILAFLAGFVPPAVVTILFKTMVATGSEGVYPPTIAVAFERFSDFDRWAAVIGAYWRHGIEMGVAYAHPLVLLVLIGWALKPVVKAERGEVAWLALPALAMAAAEFLMLVATSADIRWHTGTSVPRLLIQPWPALLVVVFCLLRRPEDSLPVMSMAAQRRKRA